MAGIALVSLGSRGDLFRMLGIGRDLRDRGHRVTMFEYGEYQEEIVSTGLRFGRIGDGSACHAVLAHPDGSARTLRRLVRDVALPRLRESVEAIVSAADAPDMVVAHEFQYAGQLAAELLDVPFVSIIGRDIADLYYPPPGAAASDSLRRDRIVRLLERLGTSELNAVRRRLGLPGRSDAATVGALSDDAVLVMDSRLFVPTMSHWPGHFQLSGFPRYHGGDRWTVPATVRSFVERDDLGPLVVCTLGDSWAGDYPDACRHLARVAETRGLRVLFLVCRGRMEPVNESCLVHPFVPIGEVLAQARAIVHHAGQGTLMTALRAGVPSLMLPHWLDGFANAQQAVELGVGRLLRADMTVGEVEREVSEILDHDETRQRAEAAAAVIARDPEPGSVVAELADRLPRQGAPSARGAV